jgi:hypothetical protein
MVQYGATISAGQVVYADTADTNKMKLADNNASAATAVVYGIAMTPGVSGGYGVVATGGGIILVGTTAAVGETYYAGATAGEIIPDADLATGNYVSRLGTASSATQINLRIENTGIVHA